GSAAGPLALHLVRHGRLPYGHEVSIRQGAEIGRPSLLRARVEGEQERIDRVVVGGSAVIVARGEYRLRLVLSHLRQEWNTRSPKARSLAGGGFHVGAGQCARGGPPDRRH